MTACLKGRTALIRLDYPDDCGTRSCTVAFPAGWERSTLLEYVEAEHPGVDARILEWHKVPSFTEPPVWIANPAAFRDYANGVRA